jgi:hypothetical protein
MTHVILRHDNPSETGGFQAGPPLRGPDGSAALIMLGEGAATGRFRCGECCQLPRATGRVARRL